jgi:hypothetical protein
MRSQALVLTMISLAVSGCGKDVERSALAEIQPQIDSQSGTVSVVQSTPVETRAGYCKDPIENHYKKLARFSEIQMATGRYELKTFDGVGAASQGPTSGISVVSGSVTAEGTLEYTEICRDLNAIPNSTFTWNVSAPAGIDMATGGIKKDLRVGQTVYGPVVADSSGAPQLPSRILNFEESMGCLSVDESIEGANCGAAEFYQIDPMTLGVLRTVETQSDGMMVRSSIFAKYALVGGEAPAPAPAPRAKHPAKEKAKKDDSTPNAPAEKMKTETAPTSVRPGPKTQEPTPKPVEVTKSMPPVEAPMKAKKKVDVKVKAKSSTGTTKIKVDEKKKSNSESGVSKEKSDLKAKKVTTEGVSKIKLDEKTKSNSETGVSKEKSDLKIKEVTSEGVSVIKLDEKSKSNSETEASKEKLRFKEKASTPNSSSKTKLVIKVKK